MRRLTRREKALAGICGILLILVLLLQGVAKPLRVKLAEANRQLEQREQVISRAQTAARNLYSIEKDIETLSSRLNDLTLPAVAVADTEMIHRVEEAAEKADIEQVDMRPLKEDQEDGLMRYPMQLEVKASFPRLKDFLYYLEEGKPPLIVDRMEVNAENATSSLIRSTILISAYSQAAGEAK
jgi:Tfp pilus assembly protein PilO